MRAAARARRALAARREEGEFCLFPRGERKASFGQSKSALRIETCGEFALFGGCRALHRRRKLVRETRDAFPSSERPRVAGQDEKARAFRGRTCRCALSDATRACREVIASPPRVAVTRACAGGARPSRTSAPRRSVASRSSHSLFVGRSSARGWSSSRARHVVSTLDGGITHARASVADDMRPASPRAWCQGARVSCEKQANGREKTLYDDDEALTRSRPRTVLAKFPISFAALVPGPGSHRQWRNWKSSLTFPAFL